MLQRVEVFSAKTLVKKYKTYGYRDYLIVRLQYHYEYALSNVPENKRIFRIYSSIFWENVGLFHHTRLKSNLFTDALVSARPITFKCTN